MGSIGATQQARQILEAVRRVVLGQEEATCDCLVALLARGHVLLEGVPGTAKTLLVRTLARALNVSYARIQFTPDLMPSDITGISVLATGHEFVFRPGPVFHDLILADEVNRAPAKTQAALLEAMQERTVTVDGKSHALTQTFMVFATQNPIEFEGTYPLPEAELDRFMLKATLGYPAEDVEQGILGKYMEGFEADIPDTYGVSPVVDTDGLEALRETARAIRVEARVAKYIVGIVRATRDTPSLRLGASPRGGIALLKATRALALIEGRDFVIPDDVKRLAPAVLRHRVTVAPELELEGVTSDQALRSILEQIEAPST